MAIKSLQGKLPDTTIVPQASSKITDIQNWSNKIVPMITEMYRKLALYVNDVIGGNIDQIVIKDTATGHYFVITVKNGAWDFKDTGSTRPPNAP